VSSGRSTVDRCGPETGPDAGGGVGAVELGEEPPDPPHAAGLTRIAMARMPASAGVVPIDGTQRTTNARMVSWKLTKRRRNVEGDVASLVLVCRKVEADVHEDFTGADRRFR